MTCNVFVGTLSLTQPTDSDLNSIGVHVEL